MNTTTITTSEHDALSRLDVFVAERCSVSRSLAQSVIKEGGVKVNGCVCIKNRRLKPGEQVEVTLPEPHDPEALPDLWGECPDCCGDRFGAETLEARVKGMHAGELLKLDAEAALRLFRNIPAVARPLEALCETGLGYVSLGQPAGTLSAGEAQRLRLAALLGKGGTAGKVRNALPGIYVLDEPARGLHFAEVEKLIRLFRKLTEAGNAVLVVEHREEMLAAADVKIEMGPGGGPSGGRILSVEKA